MRWLALLFLCATAMVHASAQLEFSLHKLESEQPGPTVLVVGGIQGDEPGGFHAASLLVTDYQVNRGSLWVVPNLNFESIIKRSRGVNGDMNRKFAQLPKNDPDYDAVERIKSLIKSPEIDFIVNLHDGSGFYREKYIDKMHSPRRWGQSIIIDQEELGKSRYSNVGGYARAVALKVNKKLLKQEHSIRVRNTRTAEGDKEMAKTLTYYAIRNNKPAVGLEASKSLPTRERVYYHMHLLENLLSELGVEVSREFSLTPMAIKSTIESNLRVSLFDQRIGIDMADARRYINYFPMKNDAQMDYLSSNPLLALIPNGDRVRVSYGNRRLSLLKPQFFEYDDSVNGVEMEIDGVRREINFGTTTVASRNFSVHPPEGYRVNIIGWTKPGVRNEAFHSVSRGQLPRRFSIDRKGTTYRVEVYREKKFSGMILVKFDDSMRQNISSSQPEKKRLDEKS